MRKQITAAGNLPFQGIAQRAGIDCNQQQIADAGKVLGRGRPDLRGGGEMDEAIAGIERRAAEHAGTLGLAPNLSLTDLVDGPHHGSPGMFDVFEMIATATVRWPARPDTGPT